MPTIVAKFGGSSLSTAAQFQKVAAILRENPDRRFVVASAPGKRHDGDIKVTDLLYQCYDAAVAGQDFTPALDAVAQRFSEIIRTLSLSFDLAPEISAIRAHLMQSPSRDYMASRGEYLNSRLLAAFLSLPFLDAADYICFTPDGHFDAEKTQCRLPKALQAAGRAVLPGFYGARPDGSIVTFSRGGSDVTGSIVAQAANASLYENWTDVSGMLSADPRIVADPRPIAYLTYRELRELSYMGATVLHEDAIFPVRRTNIPINIRNTNAPEDPGTMIVPILPSHVSRKSITGIAGRAGFSSILVEKSMMNGEIGFGARLLQIIAGHGVSFEHCPTGIDTMSVIVNTAQFRKKREQILQDITRQLQPDSITVEDGLAMLAVVGHGMALSQEVAAKVFRAAADSGVKIRMIDQGSSGLNIIIGVDEADYHTATCRIYEALRDLF